MSDLRFQPGQSIVFEGDSATSRRQGPAGGTWPFLRLMHWDKTWADHFAELLFCWRPELRLKFANNAWGGATAEGVAKRLETVRACKPDWVLATTGGNDVRKQVPLADYVGTWTTYAKALHEEFGTRTVLLGTWSFGPDRPKKMQEDAIRPYWQALVDAAAGIDHLDFLDLSPGITAKATALIEQWGGHTIFTDADNHYNDIGARIIAGEVLKHFGVLA